MAIVRDFGLALAIGSTLGWALPADGQRFPSIIPQGSETIRFEAERIIARPSISVRSFILTGLVIPAEGRNLSLRCSLGRELGGVAVCDVPGRQGDIEQAAAELAEHYRFRLDERLQDSASMLVVVIPEHISPADIRTATANLPLIPLAQIHFERRASEDELGELYPRHVGHRELTPTVRMDCEILPDLALLCVDPEVSGLDPDDPAYRAFQLAGLQATGFFRPSATLTSGAAAPGHRFRMAFRFQPPSFAK
ncbi:hypothetical protein [Sphingosinicella sp.]|uniref:hypothetical protein n=1 Tax=Sphingosinicella sp. TaxID=1917971 RepID=UPI0040384B67